MMMHQGIGLDAFNAMPITRAVHAVYECCGSVPLAADIVRGRPFANHDELFRRADALLFALSEDSIDTILQAYPPVGRRPRSTRSRHEVCSVWDDSPEVMARLTAATDAYAARFGFTFVMFVDGLDAPGVLAAVADRMHNDPETERKVVRNELARINRSRLDRMLGPEGGYTNWW